jgi:8-oxo-dGTP pyrophosphatase MutT (NUDIX family)
MRKRIGHAPLFLAGVTAIVVRDGRILLGRRSDNGRITPPTGIVDPGEEPGDAAVRETLEETGVRVRADRLVWVHQIPRVVYPNGDECDFLDLVYRCEWLEGEPYAADGELTEAGWYGLDDLPTFDLPDMRRRIELALDDLPAARFEGGR